MNKIKIKEGDIITFYGITWNDGWEFDAPSIITSPGYFYSESYAGLEGLIEDICITLGTEGEIDSEESIESDWRGWNVGQFNNFIVDSFNNVPTVMPDYFKEFRKEIGNVSIIKVEVKFIWNAEEEWYDSFDLNKEEKTIKLWKNLQ